MLPTPFKGVGSGTVSVFQTGPHDEEQQPGDSVCRCRNCMVIIWLLSLLPCATGVLCNTVEVQEDKWWDHMASGRSEACRSSLIQTPSALRNIKKLHQNKKYPAVMPNAVRDVTTASLASVGTLPRPSPLPHWLTVLAFHTNYNSFS